MRRGLPYLALAIGALAAGWFLGQSQHALGPPAKATTATTAAPAFELIDLNGQAHRNEDYRGQVILVNFWATWCAPCVIEMPLLNAAHQRYQDRGLRVLGPALDDSAAVAAFVAAHGIEYPILVAKTPLFGLMDDFGDDKGALPFTVVVDRQGQIAERHWGGLDERALEAMIQRHL